jgi:pSer/pThr/pTyr-binding forkhead associated (FHA) protein
MKACAACGARNEERSLFCRDCGGRLAAQTADRPSSGTTVTAAPAHAADQAAAAVPGTISLHGQPLPPALAAAAAATPVAPPKAPTIGGACAACGYDLPVARSVKWCPGCSARLDGVPIAPHEDAVLQEESDDSADIPVAAAPAMSLMAATGERTQTSSFSAVPAAGVVAGDTPVAVPARPAATAVPPPAGWELVLLRAGERTTRYPLRRPEASLGAAADISFPEDPLLSPVHALVAYRPPRLWVEDAGSRNGVYFRIEGPTALRPGDVLCLGSLVLRWEPSTEPPPRPPAPGGPKAFGSGRERARGRLVRVLADGGDGPAYPLTPSKTIVGRRIGHFLFPDDPLLSRQHAQFYERDGAMTVEDLGSSNGTLLRLRGPAPLDTGGVFRIGDQTLELHAP